MGLQTLFLKVLLCQTEGLGAEKVDIKGVIVHFDMMCNGYLLYFY
jgi:hypothetical protein